MERKTKLWKYLLLSAIGFAIGGALWGWECYQGTVGAGESFTNPFSFILGVVYLGFFGSLFLSFAKTQFLQVKKLLTLIAVGIAGCLIGFLVPAIFTYPLYLLGRISRFFTRLFFISDAIVEKFINLEGLIISDLWLEFLFTGLLIALFYGLVLKTKLKPLVWRGAIGLALASIISPIIGNLLPITLFSKYLTTFTLIGLIFGLFLGWGLWKSENVKENI